MDDMCGVADEREPVADEAPRDLEAERKGLGVRGEADLAQFRGEANFEFAREVLGVELEQRAGVGAPLVPDDARPAAWKRQDGEWARREEMLLRAAFMIALVGDRGDDAGLVVVPADGRDLGECAELRARAVGGDRKAGAQQTAVGEPQRGDALARDPLRNRGREAPNLKPVAERGESADDIVVERHMGERAAAFGLELE